MSIIVLHQGEFNGGKLKLLRKSNGLTMKEVGEKINKSASFISMIEKGQSKPEFSTIVALGKIFNVRHTFFLNDISIPYPTETTFFREQIAVPKRDSEQAKNKSIMIAYYDSLISNKFNLRSFQLPRYALKNSTFRCIDFEQIDSIASQVRTQFSLGMGPISNMTLLIERMGIRVNFIDFENDKIDALTEKIGSQYFISINSRITSSVRIRFNLAHELGHILLHSGYSHNDISNNSKHKRIEQEAQHFASALLMPEKGLALDMAQTNMNFLKGLKLHWLVSLQALIYRGHEIGIITDRQALFLRQTISRNGWRKEEPYDHTIGIEYPSYIKSAIKFLVKDKERFLAELSEESGIYQDELSKYFYLSENSNKNNINLKIVR
ncbi:helix-turn-helix domain-containing protein [Limosilactobacillus reuteri]|jgi:Zn-dependent peptidase ImmA (M78 family)/transcriptional regulator with XRE-family HTH domain|uniref:helix-turn-helix domain-containing protein n=1 Tax=Limosilactobacillus reuteri TaxID=1598 RepID=UPI000A2E4BEC|nr:ImmA/IrrE family metallo-endopeptidase [Limosilactobacillus reuteri]MDD7006758.1 ImmA/IrrE family metallo-endopeptidase [Lactobacillus johnsonii]MDY6194681.1 ImmA/IrrE family metallo-endopeptidase [Lactobacillus johnsonii]OTA49289.1 hypothetical protein BHL90_07710 [Limosilactobacillus reuteri]